MEKICIKNKKKFLFSIITQKPCGGLHTTQYCLIPVVQSSGRDTNNHLMGLILFIQVRVQCSVYYTHTLHTGIVFCMYVILILFIQVQCSVCNTYTLHIGTVFCLLCSYSSYRYSVYNIHALHTGICIYSYSSYRYIYLILILFLQVHNVLILFLFFLFK